MEYTYGIHLVPSVSDASSTTSAGQLTLSSMGPTNQISAKGTLKMAGMLVMRPQNASTKKGKALLATHPPVSLYCNKRPILLPCSTDMYFILVSEN